MQRQGLCPTLVDPRLARSRVQLQSHSAGLGQTELGAPLPTRLGCSC